jgi:hypothetical protein
LHLNETFEQRKKKNFCLRSRATSLNFSRSEKGEEKIIKQNSGSVGNYSLKELTESGVNIV